MKTTSTIWEAKGDIQKYGMEFLRCLEDAVVPTDLMDFLEANAWKLDGIKEIPRSKSNIVGKYNDCLIIDFEDGDMVEMTSSDSEL